MTQRRTGGIELSRADSGVADKGASRHIRSGSHLKSAVLYAAMLSLGHQQAAVAIVHYFPDASRKALAKSFFVEALFAAVIRSGADQGTVHLGECFARVLPYALDHHDDNDCDQDQQQRIFDHGLALFAFYGTKKFHIEFP
jgi:hypothetical protein